MKRLSLLSLSICVCVLFIAACSSSPGVTPATIDGDYMVEQYEFQIADIGTMVNVRDSLEVLNMEVFGQDEEFLIRYRFPDEQTSRIRGSLSPQRNSVQFSVEQGNPARILLPSETFSMRVRENGDLLTIDAEREGVDLRPYGIGQSSIDGTLHVRMVRQ